MQIGNARFLENGEVSGSVKRQDVDTQENKVDFHMPIKVSISTPAPHVVLADVEEPNNATQHNDETHPKEANPQRTNEGEP